LEGNEIELRQLRYFIKIVDLGSFSRAAGVLYVAQSALSQQVAALEAELGGRVLIRTPRGVSPTEAGKQLYCHAQVILKQAEDAKAAVASNSDEPCGKVPIGLPLSLVSTLGLPILRAVSARYPAIALQMHEELSGTILEWVKNGRLSIGLAFDDGNLEGLNATPVLEERLFLVVDAKSPLARRKTVTASELQSIELVLPAREQGNRTRLERAMAGAGLPPPKVCIEVNSQIIMRQAAAAGIGATVLAWPGIASDVEAGTLCTVEIVRPTITRVSCLCVLASVPLTNATRCVLSAAIGVISETVRKSTWRGVRFIGALERQDAEEVGAKRESG